MRLPRIAAAIVTGWGLGLSGLALQTLLRNPLASPFTLGFSQSAALGAALAIVCLDGRLPAGQLPCTPRRRVNLLLSGPYVITTAAFITAMISSLLILALAQVKKDVARLGGPGGRCPVVAVLLGYGLGAVLCHRDRDSRRFILDIRRRGPIILVRNRPVIDSGSGGHGLFHGQALGA